MFDGHPFAQFGSSQRGQLPLTQFLQQGFIGMNTD
jgi:hypothetical protein